MSYLAEFQTGQPKQLVLEGDVRSDHALFNEQVVPILRDLRSEVFDKTVPNLEQFDGQWHPLGFMSFKLGTITDFGTLRLHIWPKDLRRQSPRGPKIHDHAWHLSSLVLSGTYTDTLYEVEEVAGAYTETQRNAADLLRVYRPKLQTTSTFLDTDGTCAKATPYQTREIPADRTHVIPVHTFHTTDVPTAIFAATLMIESPRYNDSTCILMDTPVGPLTDARNPMPIDDIYYAKEQLMM